MTADPTTATLPLTWAELVALEPGLGSLLAHLQTIRPMSDGFCANAVWYGWGTRHGGAKGRLRALVGWDADLGRDERLYTREAYEVATRTLYAALPDCGPECGCL